MRHQFKAVSVAALAAGSCLGDTANLTLSTRRQGS
jgi:hypothetical protein